MIKKKFIKIMALCMLPMMLTGCWDSTEVNSRSVILELAIDKNTDYKYDPERLLDGQPVYTISYTIPDFGKLSGTDSLAKDVETNLTSQSATIATSIADIELRSKNSVSFSHVKALFLGEDLLKDPKLFKATLDALSRDMLIARNVPLLAVNGEASMTTEIENNEQPILGLYIMDYFNNKERATSFFKKQLVGTYIKEMEDTGVSTLPVFHVDQTDKEEMKGQIDISGGAVIHNNELVGYLTKEEVRGQLLVEGKVRNSPVVVVYEDNLLTYQIKDEKSKIKFKDTPEGPTCLIEMDVKGSISEYLTESGTNLTKDGTIEEIKTLLAEEIITQVGVGIDKSKEMNIDFLGIGQAMYRKHPKMWAKYKPGWLRETYQNMPISIGVNVDIQNTGIEE
ncbi:MAG: Ger(x)C family spore germination protein [Zhenhengia sp.]|uniref:Ger(x)C family spore germination protein n=1 Tax=Zhenhengia sp. TaxID=2944208 RepID=UPI00399461BE